MDDLYEDLENYNDAEEIERLRSENQDLKTKLQDQDLAIKKLQQDYDILNEEFKKLERNYSSLLKTARNEIERKTQTITNLHINKDKMVISYAHRNKKLLNRTPLFKYSSTQTEVENDNTNKSIEIEKHNSKKSVDSNIKKKSIEKENPNPTNGISKSKSLAENKPKEEKKPKLEKSYTTKEYNCDKQLNTLNRTSEKIEEKRDSNIENENKSFGQKNSERIKVDKKPLSIKDRRKSMPILSENPVIFNSDDEIDANNLRENKRSYPRKDNSDRRIIETNGTNKNKKTSKTPSLEEKSSNYHEPTKVSYRTRVNKWEKERHTRDKYDNSRLRRHNPERHNWRENPYQNTDKRRTRVLESPPCDKYDKYYCKKYRDSRHIDRPQPYDFNRHRYYDENPIKHKLPSDYEEPIKKRPRYEQQRRYPVDDKVSYEIEMENDSLAETLEQLESEYASCLSPDYEQMDALTFHPLKEIRETASSPLEDPRETSVRYVLRLDDKGKKILTTVIGRNVDIIPINRDNWCLPKVNVPPLLVSKPLQYDDEIIQNIYADIDDVHVDQNISLESGEIPGPSTLDTPNSQDDLQVHQITNIDHKVSKQEKNQKQTESSTIPQVSLDKYRIPKIKHCDSKILSVDFTNKVNSEEIPLIPTVKSKNIERREENKYTSGIEKSLILLSPHDKTIEDKNIHASGNEKLISHNIESPISVKGIVEGDLELSDETSDNIEWRHLNKNEKNEQCVDNKNNEMDNKNVKSSIKEEKSNELNVSNAEKSKIAQNSRKKDSNKEKTSKRESPVSNTKPKSRKKSHKLKDTEQMEFSSERVQEVKKIRPKKVKEHIQKSSNKFKEIFGNDSSSLITPEDLGIVPDASNKYVPFFEDAQDATDVEEIAKVKKDLMDIEKHLKPKNNDGGCKYNTPHVNKSKDSKVVDINSVPINPIPLINLSLVHNSEHLVNLETIPDSGLIDNLAPTVNHTPTISCKTITTRISIPNLKPADSTFISNPTTVANPSPMADPVLGTNPLTMANPTPVTRATAMTNASTSNPTSETEFYETLNPVNVKDPDVVKTVIISTGIQPKCIEAPVTTATESLVVNVEQLSDNTTPNEPHFKNIDAPKALATSTPHKDLKAAPEPVLKVNEPSSNLSDVNKASVETEQSENSVSVSQNEVDVPDVRIFVHRRRRTRMKPAS